MKSLCSLDGRIQPLTEARIDPLDRGYLFGDALYEAIKVLDGVILHLEPHLRRLENGLGRVEIRSPGHLGPLCTQLTRRAELTSGYLYIQISRGVSVRDHRPPPDLEPTVLIIPFEHTFDPPAGRHKRVVTVPDCRWELRDIKTTSLMATVMGKLQARRQEVDEVLFVGPGGEVREGGSTNVFVRRNDVWETHPTDGCILAGVTRNSLLRLAAEAGSTVNERAPRLDELEDWQEAFLCGTTTGVQPLVELDHRLIGCGSAGIWTRRLAAAFDSFERELVGSALRG